MAHICVYKINELINALHRNQSITAGPDDDDDQHAHLVRSSLSTETGSSSATGRPAWIKKFQHKTKVGHRG